MYKILWLYHWTKGQVLILSSGGPKSSGCKKITELYYSSVVFHICVLGLRKLCVSFWCDIRSTFLTAAWRFLLNIRRHSIPVYAVEFQIKKECADKIVLMKNSCDSRKSMDGQERWAAFANKLIFHTIKTPTRVKSAQFVQPPTLATAHYGGAAGTHFGDDTLSFTLRVCIQKDWDAAGHLFTRSIGNEMKFPRSGRTHDESVHKQTKHNKPRSSQILLGSHHRPFSASEQHRYAHTLTTHCLF